MGFVMALTADEKEQIMALRGDSDNVMTESKAFSIRFKSGKGATMLSQNGITLDEAVEAVYLKFGKDNILTVSQS